MNRCKMTGEVSAPIPKIRYQLVEEIASKPAGKIYLAHRTHYEIAVKKALLDFDRERAHAQAHSLDASLQYILSLDHPHLVRHLAHSSSLEAIPMQYTIVMEYCSGGNLHAAAQFHIPAPLIQKWTRQIVDGLAYLHAKKIVHRDLRGNHILLSCPDWNTCLMKIGHLGASELYVSRETDVGSCERMFPFMPPERILGNDANLAADCKTDIWSLGCVVLEMISGSPRFVRVVDGKQEDLKFGLAVMYYVATGGGSPIIPHELPNELQAFVAYCVKRDPVLRPLAAELFYTNFLTLVNVPQWPDPRPQRK
ncbi:uncharacterized protein LOC129601023 [Paramacrobiotus metropolitanus]|uniref:uncharacterized protein LOC129601023 n=1 Tax=Paramacrobiotus metropolitanus TaxID=2943436 RepID=UPI0024462711|nr:uncharacterized protein LOC129601023 [Paramacrobiotus metropolitanus]